LNIAVFWDVVPCSLIEFTDVLEMPTASIIRARLHGITCQKTVTALTIPAFVITLSYNGELQGSDSQLGYRLNKFLYTSTLNEIRAFIISASFSIEERA
jgi:hypothetical protein